MNKKAMIEEYLGDGVYVEFDGYSIELRANAHDHKIDTIYLEPEVCAALTRFIERCNAFKRNQENNQ